MPFVNDSSVFVNDERYSVNQDNWKTVATGVTGLTYLDNALEPGTTYWYRIRGDKNDGPGPWSKAVSAITPGPEPVLQYATVAGDILTLVYSEPLEPADPSAAISVKVSGG